MAQEWKARSTSDVEPAASGKEVDEKSARAGPSGSTGYRGPIIAEVRQSVRDLEGRPLERQTHGLKDKTVDTFSASERARVARFDIQDAA